MQQIEPGSTMQLVLLSDWTSKRNKNIIKNLD